MLRIIAMLALVLLAGCAEGPQALGITGPEGSTLGSTPPSEQDLFDNPNVLQSGERYGPSSAPTTGKGRYWGDD
ncbi:MAG TPA: hypothetical protein VGG99_19245 [Acetobacteraceae bacterium]|jgi:hypothetical protein